MDLLSHDTLFHIYRLVTNKDVIRITSASTALRKSLAEFDGFHELCRFDGDVVDFVSLRNIFLGPEEEPNERFINGYIKLVNEAKYSLKIEITEEWQFLDYLLITPLRHSIYLHPCMTTGKSTRRIMISSYIDTIIMKRKQPEDYSVIEKILDRMNIINICTTTTHTNGKFDDDYITTHYSSNIQECLTNIIDGDKPQIIKILYDKDKKILLVGSHIGYSKNGTCKITNEDGYLKLDNPLPNAEYTYDIESVHISAIKSRNDNNLICTFMIVHLYGSKTHNILDLRQFTRLCKLNITSTSNVDEIILNDNIQSIYIRNTSAKILKYPSSVHTIKTSCNLYEILELIPSDSSFTVIIHDDYLGQNHNVQYFTASKTLRIRFSESPYILGFIEMCMVRVDLFCSFSTPPNFIRNINDAFTMLLKIFQSGPDTANIQKQYPKLIKWVLDSSPMLSTIVTCISAMDCNA